MHAKLYMFYICCVCVGCVRVQVPWFFQPLWSQVRMPFCLSHEVSHSGTRYKLFAFFYFAEVNRSKSDDGVNATYWMNKTMRWRLGCLETGTNRCELNTFGGFFSPEILYLPVSPGRIWRRPIQSLLFPDFLTFRDRHFRQPWKHFLNVLSPIASGAKPRRNLRWFEILQGETSNKGETVTVDFTKHFIHKNYLT